MEPLVSVILPVCNSGNYLNDCLNSLLNQKHENIEIIAVDDNSRDGSAAILKKYHKADKRIKFSANVKRYGLATTLNRALRKTRGDFLAFMNPHDINSVWRIKNQLEFLRKNPKVVAVGTQAVSIDETGKTIEKTAMPSEHDPIYQQFLQGLSVQFETIMINKKLIPRDLLYFTHNKYPFIYIQTFVKLFKYGKFANLSKYLYFHRGKQLSSSNLSKTEQLVKHALVAIKSFTDSDYRPSLKALFQPLIGRTRAALR